jgi:2-keto-4-pentenoate hydratase
MADVSVEVAAALRDHLRVPSADERVGWKLAYGLGSLPPLVGPLTARTLLADGSSFDSVGVADLRVDAEVALAIGKSRDIAGLAVALEVVDVAESDLPLEQAIASGVTHRAVALGSTCPPSAAIGCARGVVDGEVRREQEVSVDPARSLALATNLLRAAGQDLMPGDWIITGSQVQIPVAAGDRVAAEIDGLGRVEVLIV